MSITLNGTTGITTPDITSTTSTLGALTQALDLGNTGQIVFPATQVASANANTLDDYEEGTWTPTWTPATGSGATVNIASGWYTKVGNLVTIGFRLGTNGHGTSAGAITIGGLPFTTVASPNLGVMCAGQAANMAITAGESLVAQCTNTSTTLNPVLWKATTGTTTITAAEWGVSGVIFFTGSYFVN